MRSGFGRTAELLRLELQTFEARTADDLQSVVSNMIKQHDDALAVTQDPIFVSNIRKLAEITRNNRLAAIGFVEFAQVGGLIGYGPNMDDLWYRGAYFVDKILKGTKPANIPVEQPTKFELLINLNTAKALGVTVPPTLLARADEVIE
jgi:putative tryptophan/tyrosine transport system substrate-binding protein